MLSLGGAFVLSPTVTGYLMNIYYAPGPVVIAGKEASLLGFGTPVCSCLSAGDDK